MMKKVQIKYRYRLLLYFLVLLVFIALGFTVYTLQQSKDYSLSTLQNELIVFNSDVNRSIAEGKTYQQIVPPAKEMLFTILDTAGYVIYDSREKEISIQENQSDEPEFVKAAANGAGNSLRYSPTMEDEYLFYIKKYNGYYLRTAVKFISEKPTQVQKDNKYLILMIVLLAALVAAIIIISGRLTRPLTKFNQFVGALKSQQKDFSNIDFGDDDFGEVGRKIADTFQQLEKTKLYKQEMSHNIAHELKTPVTGIRAYLETVLHSPEMPEEQKMQFINKAYIQTLRLTNLIAEVSTLNKLDEGGETYKIEEVNISKCLQEVCEEIGYKIEANNIKFHSLISNELKLNGCYSLIYSLFKNLIDNSIEHGGPGIEISLSAGIEQASGDSGYKINFTYTDTGKGVPAEDLQRIFERFYRVEEGRTRKTGGSGLGLAIVKNSVLFHKGSIGAECRPGGGIIFKFSLYSLDDSKNYPWGVSQNN